MSRIVELEDGHILLGEAEVVVELSQASVATLALEFTLLLAGLSDSLALRAGKGVQVTFRLLDPNNNARTSIVLAAGKDRLRVELARAHAEYAHAVLLRTYRDGMADVSHVHIEAELAGRSYDVTLLFAAFRAPMSPEDAERLLSR
jgi:hypothetical protein